KTKPVPSCSTSTFGSTSSVSRSDFTSTATAAPFSVDARSGANLPEAGSSRAPSGTSPSQRFFASDGRLTRGPAYRKNRRPMARQPDVVMPSSPEDAATAFGDGSGIRVLAGGTIVMPELTLGHDRPGRVLLLAHAGLAGISRANGTVTIGAMTPVSALEE